MMKSSQELIQHAVDARKNSYSPYSKYSVGAALLTESGKIFTGCNVENVSYGECICAEKTAVVKAVSEGDRKFVAIAVVSRNGASPCGSCRQVLHEFSPNMKVFIVNDENLISEIPLSELLTHAIAPNL